MFIYLEGIKNSKDILLTLPTTLCETYAFCGFIYQLEPRWCRTWVPKADWSLHFIDLGALSAWAFLTYIHNEAEDATATRNE